MIYFIGHHPQTDVAFVAQYASYFFCFVAMVYMIPIALTPRRAFANCTNTSLFLKERIKLFNVYFVQFSKIFISTFHRVVGLRVSRSVPINVYFSYAKFTFALKRPASSFTPAISSMIFTERLYGFTSRASFKHIRIMPLSAVINKKELT